jgi:hypothetical protein
MRIILIIFLICLLPGRIFSQKKLKDMPDFGKPDLNELRMSECAFDKGASAMKLLDYQEKEVIAGYGLKIKTERRVRIKIFNEKGFDAASITIPYISRIKGTKITDISAYIYSLDSAGKIITRKVEKKQIFRDKADDDVKKIKFTFPDLKPGCVVEYRYEKTEKNSLQLDPWFFQDFIPTLYSAFKLSMPNLINMDKRIVGVDSIYQDIAFEHVYNYGTVVHYSYALSDVPAFRPEPMMSSVADNLQRIEFAIQPSGFGFFVMRNKSRWQLYALVLSEVSFFGKQFSKPVPGTEALLDSAKMILAREEKINYIFQEVKKQIKWDEQQTFYAGDIAEAWKKRSGNSAEINLTLLNLLRKAGISCSPILISTRDNGATDPDFFTLSQFNGVDVLIMDTTTAYVLDGTRKYQSYKTPPENILNRNAFNTDTAFANWVLITDGRPLLKTVQSVDATLLDNGQLKGNAVV